MDTIIGTIYRPPDAPLTSFTDSLEMLQTQINSLSKNNRMPDIYIMGDFNLPAIDWESGQIDSGQPLAIQQACHKLINFAETNFLTQVVDHPTRGGNTLDLIFTNKVQDVCNSKAYETLLSDHQLIELTLSYNPLKPKEDFKQEIDLHSFRAVDVHSADYNSINDLLADVDWDKVKDDVGNDPDGSNFLATITETVLEAVLKHSPLKTGAMEKPHRKIQTTSKTKYPRTVRERRRLKQNRRKINSRIRAVQNNNPESPILPKLKEEVALIGYKIQQNILNRLQKREANAVEKIRSNPRFFYSFAKQFAKARSSVAPLQDSTGRLHDNPEKKAELLQEQYVKVFSNPEVADTIKATENIRVKRSANAFNNISFGPEDIVAAIKELDPYSATPDGDIPARVLCSCREQISYPLFLLWRDSLNSGQIPPSLKHQYITPVFKKGDKTKAENYRPVSITSHLIKVFERVLRVRLVAFLEDNAFLSKHQHGFRKSRSCLTQLLEHFDNVLKTLCSGDEVDVIYLDYAKAFDKVDHNILLAKLHKIGVGGKMLEWLRNFLLNREQTVVVEGIKSRPQKVRSGVPQGTVLGPILFILYINDQLDILRYCLGKIFADDTKLIGRICSMLAKEKLQEDLLGVIAWACANNMQLNETKFEVLNYTLNQSNWLRTLPFQSENYIYHTSDGTPLEPSSTVKDLGVLVSSDRSWSPHIFKTVNSARTMAAWILSVFSDRSPTLMVTLYKSMVRCRLEYCCPLWNPSKIGQIESIERIQREFTRRISGCKDLNYWERLKKLKLMSLQRRRERYMIIQVWKIINGQAPNCTEMEFKENERLGTRAIVPSIPRAAQCSVRTDYEHSFGVKAAQLWNILPKTIKEASTITQLKISLGDFLDKTPDFPPTQGYTARNNNSLLEWNLCNLAGTLDGCYGRWVVAPCPLRQTS